MTVATLAELVSQERTAGASDSEIVRLLNASRIKPPVGRKWSVDKLEAEYGPRLQGLARPMIQTDTASLRRRLVEAGIPQALADDPNRGAYLSALLGQRLARDETNVKDAAEAAGIEPATVRQWRHRSSGAFAAAEHRARFGVAEGVPITEDAPPEPAKIQQLRDRLQHAVAVCEAQGVGPWPGTRMTRANMTAQYNANRQVALETIAELESYGIHDSLPPVPPEAIPYPKVRRHTPIHDTSGYLWPVSLHPQLHEQRRSQP